MVRLIIDSSMGSYPVLIGSDLKRELRDTVRRHEPSSVAIVADANLARRARAIGKALKSSSPKTGVLLVPAGERSKSLPALHEVLAFLERQNVDRSGCIIAVGGGTVGDLAAFAASIWLRGIRLIAVPTSLLAMVDSSIGGKTGINGLRSKNAIGTFWPPSAVIADTAWLETLPSVNYRDAFAEVVKYGVAMDRGLFELLQTERPRLLARDRRTLERVIFRCVTVKALVVAKDERDRGPRAILNYGHTAGHALEAASRFRVSHGRAVAFGMRVAAKIALSLELCGPRLVEAQDALLAEYGLPDRSPAVDPARLLAAITHDKKAQRGRVSWVMPRRLGHAEPGHAVPAALVRRVVRRALA